MFYIGKSSGNSKRFKPHYNIATDTFYHTSKDYLVDIKKRGLAPSSEFKDSRDENRKSYSPSDKARSMISGLNKDSNGKFIVGDKFKTALNKMQTDSVSKAIKIKSDLKGKI